MTAAPLAAMGLSEKYLSLESNDCLRPHVREVLLLRDRRKAADLQGIYSVM